jgi:hypothetical protein
MPKNLGIIDKISFKNYQEVNTTLSISSGNLVIDLSLSSIFIVSRNQNITSITINNSPSSSYMGNFTLILENATGPGSTIIWPSSIKWPSGISPTISDTLGKRDIFSFMSLDGGSSWMGFVGMQNI